MVVAVVVLVGPKIIFRFRSHHFWFNMPRGRIACWKAPDAEETPQVLAAALRSHARALVKLGDELYGTCFALKHLDGSRLDSVAVVLAALRKVDPRGCYFAQEEMVAALNICVDAEKLQVDVAQQAESLAITPEEMLAKLSIMVRVMCAHQRSREPGTIKDVKTERQSPSDPKKRRHPFKFFRDPDDEGEAEEPLEEDDGEEDVLAFRSFTGKIAIEHWTVRGPIPASWYEEGETGLAVACWDSGTRLTLEVPNSCVKDRRIVLPGPEKIKRKKKKAKGKGKAKSKGKAKAKGKAKSKGKAKAKSKGKAKAKAPPPEPEAAVDEDAEDPEELEGEGEEGEEEEPEVDECVEPVKIEGIIRPGHDNSMCIFIATHPIAIDKAQILCVTLKQAVPSKKTPRDVCLHILAALKESIGCLPEMRVKSLKPDVLDDLRKTARAIRDEYLAACA